ncbi:hypothetical protein HMPREF9318_00355 [Streptococcus urinalis FB127-CNA-2]|nr:hypothetical protein HMPREF9318_00355 [Streptococcus urinalis FB127-CNA-2]VEF31969.1 multidrug ABC transporter ATPase/permease [Streptococcus urinalis]
MRAPIIVFGSIVMAFTINKQLTFWFLIMVVFLFLVVILLSRILAPFYQKIKVKSDQIVAMTREQIQGMRVIRAFTQTQSAILEFEKNNQDFTNVQLKAAYISSLVNPLTFLLVNMTLVIILWRGNVMIHRSLLTQGMLVALVNYLLQILTELLKFTMLVTSLNQAFISADRVWQIFERPSEPIFEPIFVPQTKSNHVIETNQLTFSYPNSSEASLKDIQFELKEGETLGIIGGTGSGKTTLVNLISSLYRKTTGDLMIFNVGHPPENLKTWRDWVAYVPQEAQLFEGSIRSNLTLGLSENPSDEMIWESLEMAQAKDFVLEKENQLDTTVEAFGRNFSGGQKQRLTIARALLKRAPILILDDSTSALDYLTESRLLKAIKTSKQKMTLVIVSQRTRTLTSANHILVLDKGSQVGLGNHQQLLSENSYYQAIHQSQEQETGGSHEK